MGGKLEKRRALWEERVAEEVTNLTLHREAGTEIRSHMADQNLKLGKISHQTIFSDINFILHTYHFHLHILQIQSHFTEDVEMAKIHNF